jgi:hypothetical protein
MSCHVSSNAKIMRDSTPSLRLGVDLGGSKIELIALDTDGHEILRRRIPTPQNDYPATVAAVTTLVHQAEAELGRTGSVGVGTPGAISPVSGLMKNCNSTCLNGKPLQQDIERALGREVRFANDANCFALSEASDGAAAGAETVFGVIIGTGVGGGVVVRGQVLGGANAIAGEWGHSPLPYCQPPRPDHRRDRHRQDGAPCRRWPKHSRNAGVPVFMADVKGDLSGIAGRRPKPRSIVSAPARRRIPATNFRSSSGTCSASRAIRCARRFRNGAAAAGAPAQSQRHPGRRAQLVFKIADDNGLLLLDLKDLRSMLQFVGRQRGELSRPSTATSRRLDRRDPARSAGARKPGRDLFRRAGARHQRPDADRSRRARRHQHPRRRQADAPRPRLYATFLLWLLSELFEELPEVGDMDKPKLVFFFDEAHLLFDDAPKALV